MVKGVASKMSLVAVTAIVTCSIFLPYTFDFSGELALTERVAHAKGGGSGGDGGEGGDGQGDGAAATGKSEGKAPASVGEAATEAAAAISEAVDSFSQDMQTAIDSVFGGVDSDGQTAQ